MAGDEAIHHTTIPTNGIKMHIAVTGPSTAKSTILFLHGFPELWYNWRHQLRAIPSLGDYRCVAPDLRGYGDTDAPPSPANYTAFSVVGDLVGLLDFLGVEKAFVVGHDWGAAMGWYFAKFRPDRIKGLVNLSVPPPRESPVFHSVDVFRAVYGDDYYFCRFQEVGEVEEEFAEVETGKLITKLYTVFSKPDPPIVPKETGFKGLPDPPNSFLPWLPKQDVDYYASKFGKTGFTGGLNYYRATSLTGDLMGPWSGPDSKYQVPAKFIIGDQDVVYNMPGVKDYIHGGEFKKEVPLLEEVVVMEGVPHFPNLVKPDEITRHIVDFVKCF
ncbi:Epoxide hydrolase A [Linum grandiflorum]